MKLEKSFIEKAKKIMCIVFNYFTCGKDQCIFFCRCEPHLSNQYHNTKGGIDENGVQKQINLHKFQVKVVIWSSCGVTNWDHQFWTKSKKN